MSPAARSHSFWKRHRAWLLCQAVSWVVVFGVLAYGEMTADGDDDISVFAVVFAIRGLIAIPALVGLLLAWGRDLETRALLILDAVGSAGLFLGFTVFPANSRSSGFVEFLAAAVGSLASLAGIFGLLGVLLVDAHLVGLRVAGGMGAVRAVALHPALQERGYHWMTPAQARELWELCGEAAFRLPPWEEVGTLPGITEGDIAALARVIQLLEKCQQ